ncbi:MAG: electron transfer flavoprotein beta subunit/FixA family protein, partial [Cyanobacteria bacterium]|nr:electron transfer flavoprotein beta subunit/FixA family protein [Cyanobacteriota bacterium]
DPDRTGLKGSPTIVAKTEKVGSLGGSCLMHEGKAVETLVGEVVESVDFTEFLANGKAAV